MWLSQYMVLTLISIFSQNIDELEKQVQLTLESVHLSKYRKAACLYLEFRGRTLTRV